MTVQERPHSFSSHESRRKPESDLAFKEGNACVSFSSLLLCWLRICEPMSSFRSRKLKLYYLKVSEGRAHRCQKTWKFTGEAPEIRKITERWSQNFEYILCLNYLSRHRGPPGARREKGQQIESERTEKRYHITGKTVFIMSPGKWSIRTKI